MVVGLGEELRALAAPLHVARLHERSADFYARVLDGKIVRHGQPTILQVAYSWIILNVGGGPPDDKPTVTLHTPTSPYEATSFPAHAGRGIGRTLLAAADSALRQAGCREAFLFVHEHNLRALAVYAAAGYWPDGGDRVSNFRGTRVRELRLVKRL